MYVPVILPMKSVLRANISYLLYIIEIKQETACICRPLLCFTFSVAATENRFMIIRLFIDIVLYPKKKGPI